MHNHIWRRIEVFFVLILIDFLYGLYSTNHYADQRPKRGGFFTTRLAPSRKKFSSPRPAPPLVFIFHPRPASPRQKWSPPRFGLCFRRVMIKSRTYFLNSGSLANLSLKMEYFIPLRHITVTTINSFIMLWSTNLYENGSLSIRFIKINMKLRRYSVR